MLAVILLLLNPGATELNYWRVQIGMTRQEVARIVRQPPVANVTDADRFSNGSTFTSHIRDEGELWRSGTKKLWIRFDKNQRVVGKMLEHDEVTPSANSSKKWPKPRTDRDRQAADPSLNSTRGGTSALVSKSAVAPVTGRSNSPPSPTTDTPRASSDSHAPVLLARCATHCVMKSIPSTPS